MNKQTKAMKLAKELAEDARRYGDSNLARKGIEVLSAIREALAEQPAIFNDWQPAETAPKDARILFLPKMFGNQKEQEPVNICWWSERDDGWKSDLCNDFGGTEEFDFWMPLPPIQQPASTQSTPLTPEWIWTWLMDWCKRSGTSPANYDSLFKMVSDARALRAAAPQQEPVAGKKSHTSADNYGAAYETSGRAPFTDGDPNDGY